MHRPSDFYRRVWDAVGRIPKGKVATYGEIARLCGFPGHARVVGYALHNLPHGSNIPWHRVINAQGKISFPRRNDHYQKQRSLLEGEGVVFVKERIDVSIHGWPKMKSRTE